MPAALQVRRPVCRVGMSPLSRPLRARPPPLLRPRAFFKRHNAVSRKTTSEMLPGRSTEMSSLLRSGNPLHWIPAPSEKTPLRQKNPHLPQQQPTGFLPQSRRRDMSARNRWAMQDYPPVSSLQRGNPTGMLPHLAPRRFECTATSTPTAEHFERLPPVIIPRSSTAKGTAHSACDNRRASITHRRTSSPKRERPRPICPRKEGTQPEAVCLSSQAPGAILLVATCILV